VPKVYVVSETTQHNVTPAMQYGEIVTILPPNAQILFLGGACCEQNQTQA